jgi:hypothetical protein
MHYLTHALLILEYDSFFVFFWLIVFRLTCFWLILLFNLFLSLILQNDCINLISRWLRVIYQKSLNDQSILSDCLIKFNRDFDDAMLYYSVFTKVKCSFLIYLKKFIDKYSVELKNFCDIHVHYLTLDILSVDHLCFYFIFYKCIL